MNKNILDDLLNTQGHINEDELNAYLSNSAPSKVRHKVENAMLDNDLFSDAVEGYQEMGLSAIPTLESFSDFKKKLPAPAEGAKVIQLTPMQKMMRVAAVAGALLIGVFAYNAFQSPSPDSLFADYYTHYENDISLTRRGGPDGLNQDFKEALGQYAVGEFAQSISGFEKALSAEPANDAMHFYAGLAFLEMNRFDDAITHLKSVSSNNNYARQANWYAILATLKSGKIDVAKQMLNDFVKTPGFKSEEAKDLMKQF